MTLSKHVIDKIDELVKEQGWFPWENNDSTENMKTKEEDKWREKDSHCSIYEALLFRETEKKLLLHNHFKWGRKELKWGYPRKHFVHPQRPWRALNREPHEWTCTHKDGPGCSNKNELGRNKTEHISQLGSQLSCLGKRQW